MSNREGKETGYSLLELLFVVSIISLLLALLVPQILVQKTRIIELQAQRRLRTIGSVMANYALTSETGDYGGFQELKDSNMISRNVTTGSIIRDYSIAVESTGSIKEGEAGFTIIAYPRPERSQGLLSTFAITEDYVVRVYKPGPEVNVNDPSTWEPVL